MLIDDRSHQAGRGGYTTESLQRLARVESGHYWFESRARLIIWALGRYLPEARSFLDVGCGTGYLLGALHRAFPALQLSGCDMLDQGLALVRQRVPSATIFQADARALQVPEPFDVVSAFDVIEHIADDELALERLAAAAKPGGGVLVSVPQHAWLWSGADVRAGHVRRYRRRHLIEQMHRVGLDVVRATSFVSLPLPLLAASRWLDPAGDVSRTREFGVSPAVNRVLASVLALELLGTKLGVSWPAGGSLLVVAKKRT